jgi:hypothetical protein
VSAGRRFRRKGERDREETGKEKGGEVRRSRGRGRERREEIERERT